MRKLCYICGVPGAGKSTLMAEALKGLIAIPVAKPVAHISYQGRGCQLGANRANFSGTDALPMNAQPLVLQWLTSEQFPYSCVVAEGDRLGNAKFFAALKDAGWDLSVIVLGCPNDVADARCAARGSNQNATWLAGRRTKIKNLVDQGWATDILDGTLPLDTLVTLLRQRPAFRQLFRTPVRLAAT